MHSILNFILVYLLAYLSTKRKRFIPKNTHLNISKDNFLYRNSSYLVVTLILFDYFMVVYL